MKRLITLILAIAVMAAMSVPAFAADADITGIGGTDDANVTGTYKTNTGVYLTVYSVDLAWNSMAFTYNGGTWNAATHIYDGAKWEYEENANKITVTNHSNTAIKADFSFGADTGFEAVSGTFYETTAPDAVAITSLSVGMPAAVAPGAEASVAPTATCYLKLAGTLLTDSLVPADPAASVQVGTVTVTLSVPTP